MFTVEWSDWVVRLPGSGGSPVWTIALILGAALFINVVGNFFRSIGGRINNYMRWLIRLSLLGLVIYAINFWVEANEVDPASPTIAVEIGENDCQSTILDRCPTQDGAVIDTVPPGG